MFDSMHVCKVCIDGENDYKMTRRQENFLTTSFEIHCEHTFRQLMRFMNLVTKI